ncbi:MAG: protein kinase domain-containing protein [Nocardioidaceae bacterium]
MSATSPQPPGTRVRDYRLLTQIGEGGMGVVHLAQAPDGRRVALKVLRPHVVGDREARERLAPEVASLRRVTSPRVAEVLDADPWGETPFVATRYVPGLSLHQHLREEGPITGADLRWFAACLAEAVIAVHSVGVLHRDIKPSNVLLEGRSPVLIDFGLARLAEDPRLTQTGWLLGTPGYLAPEILYGDDATAASDVHSWAATVAFAATGRPPFGGGPAMAIMDRVRRGEHDLSGIPDDVRPLVERSLAPDPRDRPELAALLATLRNDAPAGPRPARGSAPAPAEPTMPFSLFRTPAADDDRTETLGDDSPTVGVPVDAAADAPTTAQPTVGQPLPTRTQTAAVPAPPLVPPGSTAAREPYMQPPAPQTEVAPGGYPQAWRPLPTGLARVQRGGLLLGGFALVTAGFARAPYLCLLLLALLALLVRTASWTTESSRDRRYRRGRSRWYDAPLAVASTPWYLLVATGGTLMLLVWSTFVAVVVGLAYALFRLPLLPGLALMGAAFAVSLWWGPGARRLRTPARELVVAATATPWLGWTSIALLAGGVLLCLYGIGHSGVVWDPASGSPWRSGTVLGTVVHWLS